jgi:type II secretory pathway pseudopilin PulG
MRHKKRRFMTLIEILVVMILIGMISAAVLVNVQGGLEKGKEFKNQQKTHQIQQILMLESLEQGISLEEVVESWKDVIGKSYQFKKEDETKRFLDMWGKELQVHVENGEIIVETQDSFNI